MRLHSPIRQSCHPGRALKAKASVHNQPNGNCARSQCASTPELRFSVVFTSAPHSTTRGCMDAGRDRVLLLGGSEKFHSPGCYPVPHLGALGVCIPLHRRCLHFVTTRCSRRALQAAEGLMSDWHPRRKCIQALDRMRIRRKAGSRRSHRNGQVTGRSA
jgi:hypothetical protein